MFYMVLSICFCRRQGYSSSFNEAAGIEKEDQTVDKVGQDSGSSQRGQHGQLPGPERELRTATGSDATIATIGYQDSHIGDGVVGPGYSGL